MSWVNVAISGSAATSSSSSASSFGSVSTAVVAAAVAVVIRGLNKEHQVCKNDSYSCPLLAAVHLCLCALLDPCVTCHSSPVTCYSRVGGVVRAGGRALWSSLLAMTHAHEWGYTVSEHLSPSAVAPVPFALGSRQATIFHKNTYAGPMRGVCPSVALCSCR